MTNTDATVTNNMELVEDCIIERLKKANEFKGFDVMPYPLDITKFDFVSSKGCLLVKYEASSFTTPQNLYVTDQTETMEFSVFAGLRYLKNYKDAYKPVEQIKKVLTGLSIKGKRLYPKRRQFVDFIKGDIYWGYTFVIELPTAENIEQNNVIPLWMRQPE